MRIALVASLVSPIVVAEANGPHAVIIDLARGLAERGHTVVVHAAAGSEIEGVQVAPVDVSPDVALASIRADGVPSVRGLQALRDGFARLFEAVRGGAYDAVSQHAFDAAAIELATGLPVVHVLHMPPDVGDVLTVARASTARFVTVSEAAGAMWRAAGVANIDVIRNGVPALPLDMTAIPVVPRPIGLVAGRVSPEKGTALAIDVAREIGLEACVVGDIYDRDYYEREVAPRLTPGATVAPLPRANLADLMARSAVLVMPSRWPETFGLVAAEAQMAGCPVAAFAIGALPEVVRDGVGGFLAPLDDVPALTAAARRALTLDRSEIRAHARATLGLEQMVAGHERLFEQVAQAYSAR